MRKVYSTSTSQNKFIKQEILFALVVLLAGVVIGLLYAVRDYRMEMYYKNTVERIKETPVESPLLITRGRTRNVFRSVFANTVMSQREIRGDQIIVLGIYHKDNVRQFQKKYKVFDV